MMGQPCCACGAPAVYFLPFPYCAGCYRPEPAAPVTLAAMLATLERETGEDDEQTTNKTGES